jgi:hypothetical protein
MKTPPSAWIHLGRLWSGFRPGYSNLDLTSVHDELSQLEQLEAWASEEPVASSDYAACPSDFFELVPAISDYVHSRQAALRHRAMELARPSVAGRNVLDLPNEALDHIFGEFRHGDVSLDVTVADVVDVDSDMEQDRQSTVATLRLVCRRFHDLVSPLLSPSLTVAITEASLQRLVDISESALGAGVVVVRLDMRYCPGELANDLRRFALWRSRHVAGWQITWRARAQVMEENGDGIHPRLTADLRRVIHNLRAAVNQLHHVRRAWQSLIHGHADDEKLPTVIEARYQSMLVKAFEAFRDMHYEQRQLVAEGTFADRFGLALARMPHARTVCFGTSTKAPEKDSRAPLDGAEIPDSLLYELLSRPFTWTAIENLYENYHDMDDPPALMSARLLTDIPIAMHRHGAEIRDMRVEAFPIISDFSALYPSLCSSAGPKRGAERSTGPDKNDDMGTRWRATEKAFAKLTSFRFKAVVRWPPGPDALATSTPVTAWPIIIGWFGAVLSSRVLQDVIIYTSMFCSGNRAGDGPQIYLELGEVLARCCWPGIQRLAVCGVAIRQHELERWVAGMGLTRNRTLRTLLLQDVHLTSGSWVPALGLLRERMVPATAQGLAPDDVEVGELPPLTVLTRGCQPVRLRLLTGGELSLAQHSGSGFVDRGERVLATRVLARYLMGADGVENPLLKNWIV